MNILVKKRETYGSTTALNFANYGGGYVEVSQFGSKFLVNHVNSDRESLIKVTETYEEAEAFVNNLEVKSF